MRTLNVKYTPKVFSENAVRFEGETFGALRDRLIEARVPGVTSKSYIEVFVPNEGYVCLLPDEALPLEKMLDVYVHVEKPATEAQGVPVGPEPVTGQPVPPAEGASLTEEAGLASELDWRVARKREKLNRKLARITAKLERLKATDKGNNAPDPSHEAAPHHGHQPCSGWRRRCAAMRAMHSLHHGPHVPYGYAPTAACSAVGKDPSGANCLTEVVSSGKAI